MNVNTLGALAGSIKLLNRVRKFYVLDTAFKFWIIREQNSIWFDISSTDILNFTAPLCAAPIYDYANRATVAPIRCHLWSRQYGSPLSKVPLARSCGTDCMSRGLPPIRWPDILAFWHTPSDTHGRVCSPNVTSMKGSYRDPGPTLFSPPSIAIQIGHCQNKQNKSLRTWSIVSKQIRIQNLCNREIEIWTRDMFAQSKNVF